MTANSAPQIAIRRLVRGADGTMRSILVDAYTYAPVTDTTGYKVVDVGDVPEQVQDVTQPDAEKPVKVASNTSNASERGGSEFGGSSRGGRDQGFGKVPSTAAPSRPSGTSTSGRSHTPSQSVSTPSVTPSAPSATPSVGSNMSVSDSTAPSAPSAPASAPGYSSPSQGATPQNYSPATPNAAAFAAGNSYYTGDSKTYDFSNPNKSVTPNAIGATPQNYSQATPNAAAGNASTVNFGRNPEDYNFHPDFNVESPETSRNDNGRRTGIASTSSSGNNNGRGKGVAPSTATDNSSYSGMYGGVGYGGGYVADGSQQTTAQNTIDSARTTQNVTERSQAMGNVPDSATSPAASAARGQVSRTAAQLDHIGLTIAGEVTQQTLADLSSPDPATQAAAKAQVANIQATMENRAATAPWGTIENALTPGQYNSLTPGKQLNTSTKNYAAYNAALSQTVKDFYTGLNPPTNYNFTNYANTNPIPGKYAPPGWLDNIQDPTRIGPFTFGTDPAYSNPGRYTAEAQANFAAAGADYGASGAYKTSPDYGTDAGWGNFADPSNPSGGYSYGAGYGQSAVDPGWGGFAGADTSGGGYTSDSGNGNGRGSGIGGYGGGSSSYGGNSSTGGGSGYGGGEGGRGTASGGGAGMSGGGGYSPGGMGSPSGSSNDGGGYGGGGDENGDAGGGGAGTRGNGKGSYGGL